MFTGIISHIGEINSIAHPADWEISIELKNNDTSSLSISLSIDFVNCAIIPEDIFMPLIQSI